MPRGDDEFEAHVRSRAEKPPKILYRYMTVETAKAVLSTRKLRFHSPLKYNDPFDTQWHPLWSVNGEAGAERERAILDRAIRDQSCWPRDMDPTYRLALSREIQQIAALPVEDQESSRRRFIDDYVKSIIKDLKTSDPTLQRLADLQRRFRILCFCEDDRCILMWSHYAREHRGVVLGFDTDILERKYHRPLEPVVYSPEFPKLIDEEEWAHSIIFGRSSPPIADERKWALTKSVDWRYEREWRFVWVAPRGTPGEFQDYDFPPESLKELVLGCRTDATPANELTRNAQQINTKIQLTRMTIHSDRFELAKVSVVATV